jgi:hypothetical protein
MAQQTIHQGGSMRGVVIALVVIAVFVLGLAMLGNSSGPSGVLQDDVAPVVQEQVAPVATD